MTIASIKTESDFGNIYLYLKKTTTKPAVLEKRVFLQMALYGIYK